MKQQNQRSSGPAPDKRTSSGSTRQRILHLLKMNGSMNAAQLASELALTEMAVRRHMYALEEEQAIQIVMVKQAVGRPLHRYELTAHADDRFPKNYHTLALDLLGELADEADTAGLITRMFEGRKQKLLERYAPRMAGKALEQKVLELAAIQNAGGYMVEVEPAGEGHFIFNEYNCPIAQVANQYQQACSCELTLFQSLLHAQVERTECLAKGGAKCTYKINAV